jgi:glycine/D-amino acid oxidase-like deaminating enzyme
MSIESKLSRRQVLKTMGMAPMVVALRGQAAFHVAVVGAGAFGGWTAYHLLKAGARVTLIDAWGAGNARASSGGESRVIRAIYGADRIYVQLVARSYELWREAEERWGARLYFKRGGLWVFDSDDAYARDSLPFLAELGLAIDSLPVEEAKKRYPLIDFFSVKQIYYEHDAGFLLARRACQRVLEGFVAEGGSFVRSQATPGEIDSGSMKGIALADGSRIEADAYVLACGPWLGKLFPDVIGTRVLPTKQDIYYFGTPAKDAESYAKLPVWLDYPDADGRLYYGIPNTEERGFKIADDTRGEEFDPTTGERVPSPEGIERARQYLARRFPGLRGAPLLEARVCQYENSPDGHYLFDRHPRAENVWFLGGGSGHGFKLGPALGEHAALRVLGKAEIDPFFSLSRLKEGAERGTQFEKKGDLK